MSDSEMWDFVAELYFFNNCCIFVKIIHFVKNMLTQDKIENKKYVWAVDSKSIDWAEIWIQCCLIIEIDYNCQDRLLL